MNFETYLDVASDLAAKKVDFVTITLTSVLGSAPQEVGARMIVTKDGLFAGTIGGGKVEHSAIKEAIELLSKTNLNGTYQKKVNLQRDLGMSCGGEVTMFFEASRVASQSRIIIFGTGHIGQECCHVLSRLDFEIHVVDFRKDWLEKLNDLVSERRNVHAHLVDQFSDYVTQIMTTDIVLVMTMGHATDFPVLRTILEQSVMPKFLGVIGSEIKAKKLKRELIECGCISSRVDQVNCPLGEDIGKNIPAEIAISIAAQILRVRDLV